MRTKVQKDLADQDAVIKRFGCATWWSTDSSHEISALCIMKLELLSLPDT